MTAGEFLTSYRNFSEIENLDDLISCKLILSDGVKTDVNLNFRKQIVELLLNDFSLTDVVLIRKLFIAEVACERATTHHDNLFQLSFYLFNLGQIEDTFILYDAKFNATTMDAATVLDSIMITVGHEIEKAIDYIEKEFEKSPELKNKYKGILNELSLLKQYPEYDSVAAYANFLNGYFYGHKSASPKVVIENPIYFTAKPWWKFW